MNFKHTVTLFSILISGCANDLIKEADRLYELKRYNEAVSYYEKYIKIKKNTPLTEYAAYRAAMIYQIVFNSCEKSSKYFEFIVRNFPDSKYSKEARFRAIFCPNYFYPTHRKYVLADSQTYGKNAREIIKIQNKTFTQIDTISEIYAGKKLLTSVKKSYLIKGSDVFEKTDKNYSLLFKYPFKNNTSYEEKDVLTSYANIERVETKAGVFTNCIAVKKELKKNHTGNIYYYAPEIGKILVTSFYNDKETRIMELVSYE
ncbi:MAG: hypothetical protein ACP5IO_00230 [Elusimicrobiales bacterium]